MAKKNRGLIAGGLTSSAGIFVTKALSLLYITPLEMMAKDSMVYYTSAFSIYDLLINLSIAGMPYAVATMVAKYNDKEDYQAVLLIRKLSLAILMTLGFIVAVSLFVFATPLAKAIHTSDYSVEDIRYISQMYRILSVAVFVVPVLSGIRGYIQGLKEFGLYSFSQVLEQFTRVGFMLAAGFLSVVILHKDSIWAVYCAVAAAAISAIAALAHIFLKKPESLTRVEVLAQQQEKPTMKPKTILSELIYFSIPFLLTAILGNSSNIVNSTMFNKAMQSSNLDVMEIKEMTNAVLTRIPKITAIPVVIASGFAVAIIPYLTEAFEQRNFIGVRKYTRQAIETVCYIGLPVCFFMWFAPREISIILFTNTEYLVNLNAEALKANTLFAFFGVISPIISTIMLTLRMRKENIFYLSLGFVLKILTMGICIEKFGYLGAIISSTLTTVLVATLNFVSLKNRYKISFKSTFRRFLFMMVGIVAMYLALSGLRLLGLYGHVGNRLQALVVLGIYGIVGIIVYVIVTYYLHLPKMVLNVDLDTIKRRFKR